MSTRSCPSPGSDHRTPRRPFRLALALAVVALALPTPSKAQIDPAEAHGVAGDYTDGGNEITWKVANPSGPADWWNSFKDGDLAGVKIDALVADFVELGGVEGQHAQLGLYPDLGAGVPSIGTPLALVAPVTVVANDCFDTDTYYSIPALTLGSTAVHVAAQYLDGDSHCWISSDTTTDLGRTFFTSQGYASGATPFSVEIDLYVGTPHFGAPGDLLINGGTRATVQQNDVVCLDFFGSAPMTRFNLYLCVGGIPVRQLLPSSFTVTDHPIFHGSCPMTWQLCTTLSCDTQTASNVELCTIWADQTDPKPNGKPKLKFGSSAFLTIEPDRECHGGSDSCFGQKDDCHMDGTIWKVTNPAGPSDWFNVNHGAPTSGVTSLTSVSLSAFDFCAIGPCWAEVGIYPSNLTVDASGTTPDVANPLRSVGGASACLAVGSRDRCCPLTVYDLADYAVDSAAAGGVHVAAKWPAGDSCIWLGSDTDGVDSACGLAIPSDGTHSLFSSNDYTSPAQTFTGANWMMQIEWN